MLGFISFRKFNYPSMNGVFFSKSQWNSVQKNNFTFLIGTSNFKQNGSENVDIWDFDQKHYKSTKIGIFELNSMGMVLKWSELNSLPKKIKIFFDPPRHGNFGIFLPKKQRGLNILISFSIFKRYFKCMQSGIIWV